jgi:phosphoserine phosphatase
MPSGRVELAVFDMDGVLVDAESSWVLVHEHFGTDNDDSLRAFMRGEIDDLEFIRRDVARWTASGGPVAWDEVRGVLEEAPLVPGAVETLLELRRAGVRTAIVSGGLLHLARRVAAAGAVEWVFANDVEVDGAGLLTGEGVANVPLKHKSSIVRRLQAEAGATRATTGVVGNSAIDVPMFGLADVAIAFNPLDDRTVRGATHVVRADDLRAILPILLG